MQHIIFALQLQYITFNVTYFPSQFYIIANATLYFGLYNSISIASKFILRGKETPEVWDINSKRENDELFFSSELWDTISALAE